MKMPTDEDKRLHLQFIESTIERMASNSFLIKGWSITALGGLIALYVANRNQEWSYDLLFLVLLLTIMFWGHDAYYLFLERKYRQLYTQVSKKKICDIDYSMIPPKDKLTWLCTALRPILLWNYGIIGGIVLVLIYVLKP